MYAQNQDGIHFWGPGQYLNMRNIMGCAGDDFIALAPDENDSVSDITDVIIDGVFLDNADQGIRMLSRGSGRLDRVTVRNVTGTFKSFGFFINPWFPGTGGSYGNITLENIDLRQTTHKYEYTNPLLFRIGGNIETLTLRNIHHHSPNSPLALLEVGIPFYTPNDEHTAEHSHVGALILDGLQIFEKTNSAAGMNYIRVFCPVDSMVVRNTHIMRETSLPDDTCLIETAEQAEIGSLHISGATFKGMTTLIDHHAGTIGTLCLNDILCADTTHLRITGDGKIDRLYTDGVHSDGDICAE
jgi:hypothetical protein